MVVVEDGVASELKDDLVCSICLGYVLTTAMQCNKCAKLCCQECYFKTLSDPHLNTQCVSCKSPGTALQNHQPLNRLFIKALKSIKFKCKNCPDKPLMSENRYLEHVQYCQPLKLECPYEGCSQVLTKKEMINHIFKD